MLKEEGSPLPRGRGMYWRGSTVHAWQSAVTLLDHLFDLEWRAGLTSQFTPRLTFHYPVPFTGMDPILPLPLVPPSFWAKIPLNSPVSFLFH